MPSASTANDEPVRASDPTTAAPRRGAGTLLNGNFDLNGADTIMRCRPEQDRELRAWQNIWGFYVQQSGPPPRCRRLTVEEARKVESMAKSGFLFEEIRASLGIPANVWRTMLNEATDIVHAAARGVEAAGKAVDDQRTRAYAEHYRMWWDLPSTGG